MQKLKITMYLEDGNREPVIASGSIEKIMKLTKLLDKSFIIDTFFVLDYNDCSVNIDQLKTIYNQCLEDAFNFPASICPCHSNCCNAPDTHVINQKNYDDIEPIDTKHMYCNNCDTYCDCHVNN